LLIPFAAAQSPGCRQALAALRLPHLEKLLARLVPGTPDAGDAMSLSPPHERALARAYGLASPDGCIPWAAWQLAQGGRETYYAAWAWITPCHWQVGQDHVVMGHPQALQLDPQEAQQLLAAMQPYFEQDGIRLEYDAPTLWLARGELFRNLPAASLDRVVGRRVDGWMPQGAAARPLRRLQQEMQMLLYTHPVNDERVRGGMLPVNSFWVSGTGALPPDLVPAPPAGLEITHYLRDAALREDWPAWSGAWTQLDGTECARLLRALDAGQPVSVTLCGERGARTWGPQAAGWRRRAATLLARPVLAQLLEPL
jgi:hypothetical protein